MKKILAVALGVVCLMGTVACKGENAQYLDYATGIDEQGVFDSELFFFNRNRTLGADPHIIYVPQDRDETYGGYYYAYTTGGTHNVPSQYGSDVSALEIPCYRSEDMCNWESFGALEGNSLKLTKEDWDDVATGGFACAPEVYYDATEEMYYMYYSREAKAENLNDGVTHRVSRCRIGIAKSDTPIGPFEPLYKTDEYTGKRIPCIDVARAFDFPGYSLIDPHVFIDGNDKYLLVNHQNDITALSNGVFGMKMTSWTDVDYETFTCLTVPDYAEVNDTRKGKDLLTLDVDTSGCALYQSEGTVNEGAYMIRHCDKYYLTYSAFGYSAQMYSVHQAVADSPLGPFKKIAPVLDGSALDFAKGTGHHSFVEVDGETFIFYHKHGNSIQYDGARYLAIDRCVWTKNADGVDIITANGPSKCLQWLPENVSGYRNLTSEAEISVNNGEGKEYLSDGMLPFYSYNFDRLFTTDKSVTITLTFKNPVSVKAVMVYNSTDIYSAFSKIKNITFDYVEEKDGYGRGIVSDLIYPARYFKIENDTIYQNSPAVAVIDEVKVNQIQIEIDQKDRIMEFDQTGAPNSTLQLSEIVILGRKGS